MNLSGYPNDRFFFDTCALLAAGESLFEMEKPFLISSISFKELERIKTSTNKDADVKYSARLLLKLFEEHQDKYEVIIHKLEYETPIIEASLDINDDARILSDVIYANNHIYIDSIVFITNDLSLKHIANLFFGNDMIASVPEEIDTYTGYKEVMADDEKLAYFYEHQNENVYGLLQNEYLIVKNMDFEVVDIKIWTGHGYRGLKYKPFDSVHFGNITPIKDDPFQKCLFDSLSNNKITMVKGPAGSGKTYASLGYLVSKLEKHKIDKIIIFCNTVATMNSAKLGYYPGTKDEKLMDSQIGNMLIGKFGGREEVSRLIEEGKLILLPMSDIRGFDTTGMNAGIYISEAQNLDRSLMKLALQRIGDDCICIIDGDSKTQVDDYHFEGNNNGMRRASKVFRGKSIYGEITLKNIYRSDISKIAEYI